MMQKQQKLAVAAISIYAFALLAVVFRSFRQARNRGLMRLAVLVMAGCGLNCPQGLGMNTAVTVVVSAPPGADFTALSKAQATRLGITGGVVVMKIHPGGTLSNQTKMREGFVITRIGNIPVVSVAELNEAVSRHKVSYQIQGIYPGSKQVIYYNIHDF